MKVMFSTCARKVDPHEFSCELGFIVELVGRRSDFISWLSVDLIRTIKGICKKNQVLIRFVTSSIRYPDC